MPRAALGPRMVHGSETSADAMRLTWGSEVIPGIVAGLPALSVRLTDSHVAGASDKTFEEALQMPAGCEEFQAFLREFQAFLRVFLWT